MARYHALATAAALAATKLLACGGAGAEARAPERDGADAGATQRSSSARCSAKAPLGVRFYDVGQGLAALVTLPDGRRVLVDTGESPTRAGCGRPCASWHEHMMSGLQRDLTDGRLDLVWITHQHSDHIGGAAHVLERFHVGAYADNGRDADRPMVARVHDAARARGTAVVVVDPAHARVPLGDDGDVRLSALLPSAFPPACAANPNDCSIPLRIDDCASSVLFMGDAEIDEEAGLAPLPATLLQVGHHGSSTSTSAAFLDRVRPAYAVISSGKPDEGTNAAYCHPRAEIVERLSRALGAGRTAIARVFDGEVRCVGAGAEHWHDVAASDHLYVTARDGDVTLETWGDAHFERRP